MPGAQLRFRVFIYHVLVNDLDAGHVTFLGLDREQECASLSRRQTHQNYFASRRAAHTSARQLSSPIGIDSSLV